MSINIQSPFTVETKQRSKPQRTGSLGQAIHIKSANKNSVFGFTLIAILSDIGNSQIVRIAEVIMRFHQLLTNGGRFHVGEYPANFRSQKLSLGSYWCGQKLFRQIAEFRVAFFIKHSEILESRYRRSRHTAGGELTGIALGALQHGGYIAEVAADTLASGFVTESIFEGGHGVIEKTLFGSLFSGR